MIRPNPRIRGSSIRMTVAGGFREIVAMGATVLQAAANGASATFTFTFQEDGVLDKLVLTAASPDITVVGGGTQDASLGAGTKNEGHLLGLYVTTCSLNGNSLISGHVPATVFAGGSYWSPVFGHTITPGKSVLSLVVLNQSGQDYELGAGYTVR